MMYRNLKLLVCVLIFSLFYGISFAQDPTPDSWITDANGNYINNGEVKILGGRPITISPAGFIKIKGDTGGWANGFWFLGSSNTEFGGFGAFGGADTLNYYYIGPSYNSPYMTITNGGKVGIGATNPSSYTKLDIEGDKLLIRSTSNSWGQLQVANPIDNESTIAIAAGGTGSPGNDTTYIRQWIMGINPYGVGVDKFSITNKGLTTSAPFVILEGGNVGIGTTNPGAKLELSGTGGNQTPVLKITSTTGGSIFHWASSATAPNLVSGDHLIHIFGKAMSTRNSAHVGFRYVGDGSASNTLSFGLYAVDDIMNINGNGNVGIGTTNPTNKLDVNGTIRAKEIKVESNWSDFVFEDSYNLPSLNHVASYIKENKHLPDIPSAKEVEKEGLSMSQMMAKQMQKIEELTLYLIAMKKENESQSKKIAALEKELSDRK
jgi:hypothetical protein